MTEKNNEWMKAVVDLTEQYFPKKNCGERGQALVLVSELTILHKKIVDDLLTHQQ